jgi:hypothetical protein
VPGWLIIERRTGLGTPYPNWYSGCRRRGLGPFPKRPTIEPIRASQVIRQAGLVRMLSLTVDVITLLVVFTGSTDPIRRSDKGHRLNPAGPADRLIIAWKAQPWPARQTRAHQADGQPNRPPGRAGKPTTGPPERRPYGTTPTPQV